MFGYLVSELDDRLRANGNVVEVTHKRISFAISEAKSQKCASNDRDRTQLRRRDLHLTNNPIATYLLLERK
jgi:hypothetical protein